MPLFAWAAVFPFFFSFFLFLFKVTSPVEQSSYEYDTNDFQGCRGV